MKEYFNNIIDVKFTAEMEEELDKIEEGQLNWIETIKEFYPPFDKTLQQAEQVIGKLTIEDEVSDVVCDKCGRLMVYKMGRFGKFLACPGFPECRNAKPIIIETGVICNKCGGKIIERKSQKGKKYFACENNCGVVLWDAPTDEKCPKCGSIKVMKKTKNKEVVFCSNKECEESRTK